MYEPTDFAMKVYNKLQEVPKGKITTYKDLGLAVGIRSSQAIGQILKRNPFAPDVPCHRVVTSDGKIGGFAGKRTGEQIWKKIGLLKEEGISVQEDRILDFQDVKHTFI